MKQHIMTVALICSALLYLHTPTYAVEPDRPNMIVILVDDMRWDEMGAAGHPFLETPNIDRLAKEGARFLNAFTVTALCSPSRASFLTGQYPGRHGIIDNASRGAQSHKLDTFPKRLHSAGYETAFVGKWHMGDDATRRPGFDYWVSLPGQGMNLNPELNVQGKQIKAKGHVTDVFTDYAVEFLEQDRKKPFMLYLAHKALHPSALGNVPCERHKGRYADAEIPRRKSYGIVPTDKPALMRNINGVPPISRDTVTRDECIRGRSEMLLGVDESLGRIVQTLEKNGQLDNTVIVLSSDHGFFYGEHCLNIERRLAYEETIRIPYLMRYPARIKAGSTPGEMVLSIDLAPTLLELAGVPATGLPARSLTGIFDNHAADWRKAFLIEHHSDPASYLEIHRLLRRAANMGYKAIRTEKYKYIQYTDLDGMDEFYDLVKDPYELRNRINEPEAKATVAELKAELVRLVAAARGTEAGRASLEAGFGEHRFRSITK